MIINLFYFSPPNSQFIKKHCKCLHTTVEDMMLIQQISLKILYIESMWVERASTVSSVSFISMIFKSYHNSLIRGVFAVDHRTRLFLSYSSYRRASSDTDISVRRFRIQISARSFWGWLWRRNKLDPVALKSFSVCADTNQKRRVCFRFTVRVPFFVVVVFSVGSGSNCKCFVCVQMCPGWVRNWQISSGRAFQLPNHIIYVQSSLNAVSVNYVQTFCQCQSELAEI